MIEGNGDPALYNNVSPVIWTIPTGFLTGAAGGVALINSVANIDGFFAATILGAFGLWSISRMLIERARTGSLSHEQLQGGTFTITNLGVHGIDFFTPILNLPQSAILGIGRVLREPIVQDDAIVPGETLALSLTFDHRVIDGATAARWLKRLSQLIENPTAVLGDFWPLGESKTDSR